MYIQKLIMPKRCEFRRQLCRYVNNCMYICRVNKILSNMNKNQATLTADMWRSFETVVSIAHRAATQEEQTDVKKVYDFIQSDDCKMITK